MTIKDIAYITSEMAQALRGIKEINVDTFNRCIQLANEDLKRTVYGQFGEKIGYEMEAQISDALLPFKKWVSIDLTTPHGIGVLPTDYWHKIRMTTPVSGTKDSGYNVDFVTGEEWTERINNSVTTPTETYPIVEIRHGFFYVYPTSIVSVNFTYLSKGNTPTLKLKTENGIQVYDSDNSIQLTWGEDRYIDIIRIILGYLNIPVSNDQVLAYMEQKVDKTN